MRGRRTLVFPESKFLLYVFSVVLVVLFVEFCSVGAAGDPCGLPFRVLSPHMSSYILSSLNSSLYCFFD